MSDEVVRGTEEGSNRTVLFVQIEGTLTSEKYMLSERFLRAQALLEQQAYFARPDWWNQFFLQYLDPFAIRRLNQILSACDADVVLLTNSRSWAYGPVTDLVRAMNARGFAFGARVVSRLHEPTDQELLAWLHSPERTGDETARFAVMLAPQRSPIFPTVVVHPWGGLIMLHVHGAQQLLSPNWGTLRRPQRPTEVPAMKLLPCYKQELRPRHLVVIRAQRGSAPYAHRLVAFSSDLSKELGLKVQDPVAIYLDGRRLKLKLRPNKAEGEVAHRIRRDGGGKSRKVALLTTQLPEPAFSAGGYAAQLKPGWIEIDLDKPIWRRAKKPGARRS